MGYGPAVRRYANRTDLQLRLLVGLVVCLGLVAIGSSTAIGLAAVTDAGDPPSWILIVAIIALITVGDLLNIEVRVRSTLHGTTWTDAAILIGLAVLPFPWVVLAAAVGVAVARAIRRLQPMKFAFAVAKESTTAITGGLVVLGFGSAGPSDSIWILAAAFAAMTVVDQLLAIPVIALASRTRIADRFRSNWDIRLVAMVGRLAVAVLAILALQAVETLIYALPLFVLLAYLWHERWVRTREEREAWQNLAAATEAFTGVDLDVVLREAVVRGAKLFSADLIEVEVWLGLSQRLVRGADTILYDGDPAEAPPDGGSV